MYTFQIEPPAEIEKDINSVTVAIGDFAEGYMVAAQGTITYDDKSEKSYTIYSTDDKIFAISVLTGASDDINSPSENQLDPFDIFSHANIDDSKITKNYDLLYTSTIGNMKIIIYDEEKRQSYAISNISQNPFPNTG